MLLQAPFQNYNSPLLNDKIKTKSEQLFVTWLYYYGHSIYIYEFGDKHYFIYITTSNN